MRAALNIAHLGFALCLAAGVAAAQTSGSSGAGQSIGQLSGALVQSAGVGSQAVGFTISTAAAVPLGVAGAVAHAGLGLFSVGEDVQKAGQRLPLEVAKETLLPQPDKEPRP